MNRVCKVSRLVLQRCSRCRRCSHKCRILLRGTVELRNGLVYLYDTDFLFVTGSRDFSHDVGDTFYACNDLIHRMSSLDNKFAACVDFVDRVANQRFDFLCCIRGPLCESSYLGSDNRESPALITGTGRFNCSIQGKDICLERNAIDHANDVDDFFRLCMNQFHHFDNFSSQ